MVIFSFGLLAQPARPGRRGDRGGRKLSELGFEIVQLRFVAVAKLLLGQEGEILLAGNGNVCSIDATADVHILSEGGRHLGKRLKILLPDQRNVAPINATARIDVTNENAHANSDVACVCAVADAEQVDGDRLSVTHVGEIHSDLTAVNNWRARNGGGSTAPWSYGGTGNRNWSSKGDDNLSGLPLVATAAAFNPGSAGERQIDVEVAGCPMCLS